MKPLIRLMFAIVGMMFTAIAFSMVFNGGSGFVIPFALGAFGCWLVLEGALGDE